MRKPTDETDTSGAILDDSTYEADIGDRKPSEAVVDVLSAILDTEPTELTPLFRTIDPDALDALCANADPSANPSVTFDYEGLVVEVSVPNEITVYEP